MPRHKHVKEANLNLSEEQLKMIFKQHDSNHDGQIDKKELKAAFQRLGGIIPNWRAGRAIYHADRDDDGFISEQELDALVKYAAKKGYHV